MERRLRSSLCRYRSHAFIFSNMWDIRRAIRQQLMEGRRPEALPPAVAEYILARGLYQESREVPVKVAAEQGGAARGPAPLRARLNKPLPESQGRLLPVKLCAIFARLSLLDRARARCKDSLLY